MEGEVGLRTGAVVKAEGHAAYQNSPQFPGLRQGLVHSHGSNAQRKEPVHGRAHKV